MAKLSMAQVARVQTLRAEAVSADDLVMVMSCDLALDGLLLNEEEVGHEKITRENLQHAVQCLSNP